MAGSGSSSQGDNGNGGQTNSPLLFFVALGFGVVFTNLWIIVGVKYCFRYNQRNRQLRAEEAGDPIDLLAVPRPHRRRREKKLMTMDEVNERFPLIKYKAWRAARADKGLPTAGGVDPPPGSRPQSLKEVLGTITLSSTDCQQDSSVAAPAVNRTQDSNEISVAGPPVSVSRDEQDMSPQEQRRPSIEQTKKESSAAATSTERPHAVDDDDDDDDHDDPIRTALPTELLENPGDSCAICLDLIEDDDDIRGLTCGHAFHASCVDPWLTSRRACCPLCKADYYVPKPRPEGVDESQGRNQDPRSRARDNAVAEPEPAYAGSRIGPFSPRMVLPGRFISTVPGDVRSGFVRAGREQQPGQNDGGDPNHGSRSGSWRSRFPTINIPRINLPSFNRSGRSHQNIPDSPATTTRPPEPTPGQLESGIR
ncbi:hypothetical protein VTO42DRAFT_6578 [Malbranchea cinnamomea]